MRIPKTLVEVPMEHGIYKTFFAHLEEILSREHPQITDIRDAVNQCRTALDTYRDDPAFKKALLGLRNR